MLLASKPFATVRRMMNPVAEPKMERRMIIDDKGCVTIVPETEGTKSDLGTYCTTRRRKRPQIYGGG
jgi:hypothetical protein